MGLYLCLFDASGNELEGVEVGSYEDFNFFRDAIVAVVEKGEIGRVCPVLNNHSDCDGEWTSENALHLLSELDIVAKVMRQCPPVDFNSDWKNKVAKQFGIRPETLLDCFFDIDGEPLIERLEQIVRISISSGQPILFQ